MEMRENFTQNLWDVVRRKNVLFKKEWLEEAAQLVHEFQNHTVENIRRGYTGTDVGVRVWTFSSSLMYSLTVFTTIGKVPWH